MFSTVCNKIYGRIKKKKIN
jgi:uncharacterized protein YicC (UPF0701 family)